MKYAYYLSCINESMTKEVDRSIDLWKETLDLELVRLESCTCCGGSNVDFVSKEHFIVINARNIALAEKLNLDMVTSCNTCLLGLRSAKSELDSSPELKKMANKHLAAEELEYSGRAEIKHLLWVINEDYGLEKLSQKVTNPLKDLKLAPFYGCHILRPSYLMGVDDPNSPSSLDQLIEALGGKVVDFDSKNKCCGFHTLLTAEQESVDVAAIALNDAIDSEADYIVTPCPLCHTSLDGYQYKALRNRKDGRRIPILHLSQLVGLALGFSRKELGIDRHMVT